MNKNSMYITKKKIEKIIIEELYKKEIIDFIQFNNIIGRIDEDIVKTENMNLRSDDMNNIIVTILV